MADKKLRVFKLKSKKPEELTAELEKYKDELNQLRVSKVAGSTATKLGKIKVMPFCQNWDFFYFLGFQKGHREIFDCDQPEFKTKSGWGLQKEAFETFGFEIKEDQKHQKKIEQTSKRIEDLAKYQKNL